MKSLAKFERRTIEDGNHRFTLWRPLDKTIGEFALFICLNPSTADAKNDDPTSRRCVGFVKEWNKWRKQKLGGVCIVNLFALRATNPQKLKRAINPVGENNDEQILSAAHEASLVIAAWGNNGVLKKRAAEVRSMLDKTQLHCLGLTKRGQPKHPLYLPNETCPTPWN